MTTKGLQTDSSTTYASTICTYALIARKHIAILYLERREVLNPPQERRVARATARDLRARAHADLHVAGDVQKARELALGFESGRIYELLLLHGTQFRVGLVQGARLVWGRQSINDAFLEGLRDLNEARG